ncbi:MAG TPA: GntR family transcriptional regulator [Amycolatopsis sp.]|nr:GntR family transcriptional regulator [Amycolatopsis sp.]
MTTNAEPLRVPKTAEVLAGRIRTQILRGDLREGESLPTENELMERFSVSRHVLREAYRILESERLITIRRGAQGGPRVLSLDPRVAARHVGTLLQVRGTTLTELQKVRIGLEPLAVRWLTESPDAPAAVTMLRKYNERAAAAVEDLAGFATHSFGFHRQVVELAGNKALTVVMDLIAEIVELHITVRETAPETDRAEQVRDNKRSVRANSKMLRLVESGDADAAEAYWREHITAVVDHLARIHGPTRVVDLLS